MKKVLVILLTLTMCLALISCGKEKESAVIWTDELKNEGKIVVGISPDYPPFENLTTDGQIEGFDVDVMNALKEYLDPSIEIEFASMAFDTIVTAVQTGQVDIGCSGFTYDADRDVIFTNSYIESGQAVMVSKESGIKTIADLKGKTVGAQTGSTGYDAATEIEGTKEVAMFEDSTVGISSVGKNIDAYVSDYGVVKAYADSNDMVVLDEMLLSEEMSIIVKTGNNLLAEKINSAIDEFKNSSAYEELRIKWGI